MLCVLAILSTLGTPQLTVDAGRGPVKVELPPSYNSAEPTPLILLLHPFGGSSAQVSGYIKLKAAQLTQNFMFCAPEGTIDSTGNRFWNATIACCDFNSAGVDDSTYLRNIIDAVEDSANVDPRSIHIIGYSNGGFMSYRMACDHPDKIASIACLAGASYNDPANCTSGVGEPVHVLHIHGFNDDVVGYSGGDVRGKPHPGAYGSAIQWAERNGCEIASVSLPNALDLDALIAGDESSITRFEPGCRAGGSVELWSIPAGTHRPALSSTFADLVVRHLLERPKPAADYVVDCLSTTANSTGLQATLAAQGSDVLADNALVLNGAQLPANSLAVFLGSKTLGAPTPAGSLGFLCLAGSTSRLNTTPISTGTDGLARIAVDLLAIPQGILPPVSAVIGETWHFQALYTDSGLPGTTNYSLAASVTIR